MYEHLARWNKLTREEAAGDILPCCGSDAWAKALSARRPFASEEQLFVASDLVWKTLSEEDWMQAFASHPRIGQRHADATARSLAWSAGEQNLAMKDSDAKAALAEGNRLYEERFGRTFIVCASGRSSSEMLHILDRRMENDRAAEWSEAGEQQRQITQIRLRKWLGGQ